MNIPHIIHQIWFQGYDNIPKHLLEYHNSWVEKHPDYEIIVWDEERMNNLVDEIGWMSDLYYGYEKMIQKIDIIKYVILYYFGGIYVDIDIMCIKPLDELLTSDNDIILSTIVLASCKFLAGNLPIPISN